MNDVILCESIVKIFFIVSVCALPVLIIWLDSRKKMNETNNRAQLLLTALEKNPDMDMSELVNKMTPAPKEKLLKEKLLTKLLWGCILTGVGIGLFAVALYFHIYMTDNVGAVWFLLIGGAPFAAGVAFLVNYFLGKKMLAKEMEAEERNMTQA